MTASGNHAKTAGRAGGRHRSPVPAMHLDGALERYQRRTARLTGQADAALTMNRSDT